MSHITRSLSTPIAHTVGPLPDLTCVFPAFRDMSYPFLLDGAAPSQHGGQISYLSADPFLVVRSHGRRVSLNWRGFIEERNANPWMVLKEVLSQFPMDRLPGIERFQGGVAGYFSYDLGRHIEFLPSVSADDLGLSEMCVGLYDWVLAHDGNTGQTHLFSTGLPEGSGKMAEDRVKQILRRLENIPPSTANTFSSVILQPNFTRDGYISAVHQIKEYLAAGDVYQVNLSQRFQAPFSDDPWSLYLRLRQANPEPFSAYLETPEATILSASPEEFLRLESGRVQSRPIKGTRPRGHTTDEDRRLANELLHSDKDRAENVMIVDLLRNDLGRVCRVGSIEVPSLFAVEPHPSVWHLVSTVTGQIREDADAVDLLRACFPGGSVTGAPKIRAMEISEELEPVRRGIYCGSIGYISFAGDMNTDIVIRTLVMTGGRLYLQVGGGIVADSDPEAEYQETLHKAAGIRQVLGMKNGY
jgi:para-aminobenzoate synthetase component 1